MNQMTLPTIEIGIVVTIDGSPIDLLDVCARDPVLAFVASRWARGDIHDARGAAKMVVSV